MSDDEGNMSTGSADTVASDERPPKVTESVRQQGEGNKTPSQPDSARLSSGSFSPNKTPVVGARKLRNAAKSFETGGVNLSTVKKTPALPTVVDIKSLCSLEASFDENANNERLQKMQQWQKQRKQAGATKILCNYLYTFGLRRRFFKAQASIISIQCTVRRHVKSSVYTTLRRAAIKVQKILRGYRVRKNVASMRVLALRLGKLRVVYNLKIRRVKRLTRAAIAIQSVYRRMKARRRRVEVYLKWTECRDSLEAGNRIIRREVRRKSVLLANFVKGYVIRSTLWASIAVFLLSTVCFFFSFSDSGMSPLLKETDLKFVEASQQQLYYGDSAQDSMISGLLERYASMSMPDLVDIPGTYDSYLGADAVHGFWCGGRAAPAAPPSWTLSQFSVLLLVASATSAVLALMSSLIVSRMLHQRQKLSDFGKVSSWKAIRQFKGSLLKVRLAAASGAAVVAKSVLLLSISWIALLVSLGLGLIMTRFHFFWFVLPHTADVCHSSSVLEVSPVVHVTQQLLSAVDKRAAIAIYLVQVAELIVYGLILLILSSSIFGLVSYFSKLNKALQSAQAELTKLTGRIDAILKKF